MAKVAAMIKGLRKRQPHLSVEAGVQTLDWTTRFLIRDERGGSRVDEREIAIWLMSSRVTLRRCEELEPLIFYA